MSITLTARPTVTTGGLDRRIAMLARIEAVIADFAQRIYDTAYPNIPEETGRDRASLKIIRDGLSATISLGQGIDPPYPVYQELGFHLAATGQFIQNAALIPAFEQHREAFVAAIRAAVEGG